MLLQGTRGGGKSDCMLADFAQHVGEGWGAEWQGIIFRPEYKELKDIIKKSKKLFPKIFPGARFLKNPHNEWHFPTGEVLTFAYGKTADDYDKFHGQNYTFIGFEELTNWADEDFYDSMKSCLRSTCPGIPLKIRANCNPWGKGFSWVKARFIDPAPCGTVITDAEGLKRVSIFSSVLENRAIMENDPSYIKWLRSIPDKAKRKAWLEGSWDNYIGTAFGDYWKPEKHIIQPFDIPHSWYIDRAMDWGESSPFSVGWFAQADGTEVVLPSGDIFCPPSGSIIEFHEWYGAEPGGKKNEGLNRPPKWVAKHIKEREQGLLKGLLKQHSKIYSGPADNQIRNGSKVKDDEFQTIEQKMQELGVYWNESNKNAGSRVTGATLFREMLWNTVEENEDPHYYVFDTCRTAIAHIPKFPRDDKDPDDVLKGPDDHDWDMRRYRILHKPNQITADLPVKF